MSCQFTTALYLCYSPSFHLFEVKDQSRRLGPLLLRKVGVPSICGLADCDFALTYLVPLFNTSPPLVGFVCQDHDRCSPVVGVLFVKMPSGSPSCGRTSVSIAIGPPAPWIVSSRIKTTRRIKQSFFPRRDPFALTGTLAQSRQPFSGFSGKRRLQSSQTSRSTIQSLDSVGHRLASAT